QADAKTRDRVLQRRDLPAKLNANAPRRRPVLRNRFVQFRYCFAKRDAVQVRCETDDTLPVIALDEPGHCSRIQGRDIPELRVQFAVFHDRQVAESIDALNTILWKLHLDLKRLPDIAVNPIIRLSESR